MSAAPVRHKSEDVIINAPMSFAGSAQRAWRLRRAGLTPESPWLAKVPMTVVAAVIIVAWWAVIVVWYVVFGILLIPYRLLRRGSRKRKKQALQHREMMAALEKQQKS